MSFQPLVSIVIPVFNGANYLRAAIDSALAQTYQPIEVLVVNDGSRDDGATERIALEYGDRLRYFAKPNGGVATALNLGIREMHGDYFSWLSHDDLYYPNKLSVQVDWLRQHESERHAAILFSDYDVIDGDSRPVRTDRLPGIGPRSMMTALLCRYPVHGCTTLIPRACIEAIGTFDESLRTTQDYQYWFRLARRFPFVHLEQPLIASREHHAQGRLTLSAHARECDDLYCWALDYLKADDLLSDHPDRSLAERYYACAKALCHNKRANRASRYALRLCRARAADERAGKRLTLLAAACSLQGVTYVMDPLTYAVRTARRWFSASPVTNGPTKANRWRPWRFSLRSMFLVVLSIAIFLWWWQRPFVVEKTVGGIRELTTVRRGFNLRLYHWGVQQGFYPTGEKAFEVQVYGPEIGSESNLGEPRFWHRDGREFEEMEWGCYMAAEYYPLMYGKPDIYSEEQEWRARYEEWLAGR